MAGQNMQAQFPLDLQGPLGFRRQEFQERVMKKACIEGGSSAQGQAQKR